MLLYQCVLPHHLLRLMSFQHLGYHIVVILSYYHIVEKFYFCCQCLNKFHHCFLCNFFGKKYFLLESSLWNSSRIFIDFDFGCGISSILDDYNILCCHDFGWESSRKSFPFFFVVGILACVLVRCALLWLNIFFSQCINIIFKRIFSVCHFGQEPRTFSDLSGFILLNPRLDQSTTGHNSKTVSVWLLFTILGLRQFLVALKVV